MLGWIQDRIANQIEHLRHHKKCKICRHYYHRDHDQCDFCSDLSDEELALALKKRRKFKVKLGQAMLAGAIVLLLLMVVLAGP